MKDATRIYSKLNLDFESRWFTILYGLNKQGSMTITALAQTLRLTHPAVNQLAGEMIKENLIISSKGVKDERKRFLRLSAKGKRAINKMTPVWREIRLATKELLDAVDPLFLASIEKIEAMLDDNEMYDRVILRIKGELEILEYRPQWKRHFKELNIQWLKKYFHVEEEDKRLLSNPNETILKPGGAILFARFDSKIVGTCALIKHSEKIYEISKLAVSPNARGFGAGIGLSRAILDRAIELGAGSVYLQTNPKLIVANHIYKVLGFRKTKKRPFDSGKYQRPTLVMRKKLTDK